MAIGVSVEEVVGVDGGGAGSNPSVIYAIQAPRRCEARA
jgi:hypothetical protein